MVLFQPQLPATISSIQVDAGGAGQMCKALACLTDDHLALQQACTLAIAPLVSLLSHSDTAVVEQACQALACLVSDCHHHQTAAGQAGAVLTLMNLICNLGATGDVNNAQRQQEIVHLLLALLIVATQVKSSLYQLCTDLRKAYRSVFHPMHYKPPHAMMQMSTPYLVLLCLTIAVAGQHLRTMPAVVPAPLVCSTSGLRTSWTRVSEHQMAWPKRT